MSRNSDFARRFDRASEAVILAIVVLAPWAFGAVEAWAGLLIAAAIVSLAMLGVLAGGYRGGLASPGLALVGLALLALTQCIPLPSGWTAPVRFVEVMGDPGPPVASTNSTIAQDREAAIGVAFALGLAWVFFQHVVRLAGGRRVAAAIAINAACLALFAMIQALSWNGRIYWVRESPQDHAWFAGGPFVCHSHLAAYLNLGLGFAIGFLMEPVSPERNGARGLRLGWAYVAGMTACGVIGSQSRGGTVAMLVAVAGFFVMDRRLARRALAAIAMSALFLAFLSGGEALRRLATVFDPGARGYSVRFEVWRAGLRAWLERPVLGAGFGGFATAAAPFLRHDWGVTFTHAENEPIGLLAEGGLVALVIAGVGVVAMAVVARRALRATSERSLAMGATFGLTAVAIQSVADFPLHIPAVAMAATASAALLTRIATIESKRFKQSSQRRQEADSDFSASSAATPRLCVKRFDSAIARAVFVWPWRLIFGCHWSYPTSARDGPPEHWSGTTSGTRSQPPHSNESWSSPLVSAATLGVALLALSHAWSLARSEAALAGSGVPLAGPAIFAGDEPTKDELLRMALALERALIHRPDWFEGHLRLGATRMALYEVEIAGWIEAEPGVDPAMANPLWLLRIVHEGDVQVADLTGHEPVARYLIPAARSFLEARRANPVSAAPYVWLASLDYLLKGDEPAAALLDRGRRLAGADAATLSQADDVAEQLGDLEPGAIARRDP
jgi:O-antigen ligase